MHTKYLQRYVTEKELHDIFEKFCIIVLLCWELFFYLNIPIIRIWMQGVYFLKGKVFLN